MRFLINILSKIAAEYSVLVGSPAKCIASNMQRIFSLEEESYLVNYFRKNPEAEDFPLEKFEDDFKSIEKRFF